MKPFLLFHAALLAWSLATLACNAGPLPAIRIAADGRTFETSDGHPFTPFGVNYFRPNTGWAPQLWKKWDPAATRADFALMKKMRINCVRVFLTYGSFYSTPGQLDPEGLKKFDEFLGMAEEAGIYVHPTGPDHWEGFPEWAWDRFGDDKVLPALETFWKLFAARYKNRSLIFAYDLLNEPEVPWDSPALRRRWAAWLNSEYGTVDKLVAAWKWTNSPASFDAVEIPPNRPAKNDPRLLAFQQFRESVADEWTRRQAAAIKSVAPGSLVTVGLIQWGVPVVLAHPQHYSAFRPDRQARFLDFLDFHFYPLESRPYEYKDTDEENRNLAYLEIVAQEVARARKPVVVAEFGWYGGGKPRFDGGKHPFATEDQQARWMEMAVRRTLPYACGWLNWGLYDQPEATDPTEFMGLLTADGKTKTWGKRFTALAEELDGHPPRPRAIADPSDVPWNECITDPTAANAYRNKKIAEWSKAANQK